jgi:hypothetical protein
MLIASLLPAGTPPLVRLAIEVGSLLLAARLLLDFIRRARVGVLALAAAAWVWFFYPPGHAWMLALGHRAVAGAGQALTAIAGQAMRAAGQSVAAVAKSAASAHGSAPAR